MTKWILGALPASIILAGGLAFTVGPQQSSPPAVSFEDATLRIRIDISERTLVVEQSGELIRTYNIAVGSETHPTPTGSFSVERIIWNPRWVPPASEWAKNEQAREPGDPKNPMGRVKIFFRYPSYYIHGTNSEASIGTAASHGCVRMLNSEVIELAQLLIDRSGTPVEPGLVQRLIHRVRQKEEFILAPPVPLEVVD
ncbi:MAG: L,D-transpeptidase [Gemmatimonadetes bacterium]|nr:L,D-transpeptidase [Gemmatimonadota bacterium]